jgi:MSHA biogenesis protein MshE
MTRPEKVRLGDLLIQQNLITEEQLQFALEEQKRNGRKLGRVLADNGFVSEEQISETLAKQLHIPYVNLKNYSLNLEIVRRLPENQARRFRALALEERNGLLLVGMADPMDLLAFDELGRTLKRNLDVVVVTEGQLLETIDRVYRRTEEIGGLARELSDELGGNVVEFATLAEAVGIEEAPLARLLQTLFGNATQAGASDIHIEPLEGRLQIRFRINGMLHPQTEVDPKLASALVMRLKLMAGMDVSEKRLPQEGNFSIRVRRQSVDVRVSVLPTLLGESVVIHLANRSTGLLALDKLGMQADLLQRLRKIVRNDNGMVLVAGPADSGKTATLYAVIAELNTVARKTVAVGSGVGYRLPGVMQVQENDKAGLTTGRALRSALQQDPDTLLVGEICDTETAEVALRAAMSECLVLAGLTARDAASTLPRLLDMGVPPYLATTPVMAVLAQRLLRRVCGQCSEAYTPSAQEAEWLSHAGVMRERWDGLRRGRGCPQCDGAGYNGRIGVYEMLEMDRKLVEIAVHGDSTQFMRAAHAVLQGKSLLDDAFAKMAQGLTSVTEVMRIANQLEDQLPLAPTESRRQR